MISPKYPHLINWVKKELKGKLTEKKEKDGRSIVKPYSGQEIPPSDIINSFASSTPSDFQFLIWILQSLNWIAIKASLINSSISHYAFNHLSAPPFRLTSSFPTVALALPSCPDAVRCRRRRSPLMRFRWWDMWRKREKRMKKLKEEWKRKNDCVAFGRGEEEDEVCGDCDTVER